MMNKYFLSAVIAWNLACVMFCIQGTHAQQRSSQLQSGNRLSGCSCSWSEWMNNNDYHPEKADDNSYENLRQHYSFCDAPSDIECRSTDNPAIPFNIVKQKGVECDVNIGLVCISKPFNPNLEEQPKPLYCIDYQIRVSCCTCIESTPSPVTSVPSTMTIAITTTASPIISSALTPSGNVMGCDDPATTQSPVNSTPADFYLNEGIPVSIIIVIILGVVLFIGVIGCFLVSKGICRKRKPVPQQKILPQDICDFQKPITMDELDAVSTSSSSRSISSSEMSYRAHEARDFKNGKLEFLPLQHHQPDVIVSLGLERPPAEYGEPERRWFPDEYELNKERQQTKKKSKFVRSFSPVNKNIPFMDDGGS